MEYFLHKYGVMQFSSAAGLFRSLCVVARKPLLAVPLAAALLVVVATDAMGGTWQWTSLSGRERLIFDMDAPRVEARVNRTGSNRLDVLWQHGTHRLPETFTQQGQTPASEAMLEDVRPSTSGFALHLRTPAFGYFVTRPSPNRVVVDIFYDPLGARWTPTGTLAPASAAAAYTIPAAARPANGTPALAQQTPAAPAPSALPMQQALSERTPAAQDSSMAAVAVDETLSPTFVGGGDVVSTPPKPHAQPPRSGVSASTAPVPSASVHVAFSDAEDHLPLMAANDSLQRQSRSSAPAGHRTLTSAFSPNAYAADAHSADAPAANTAEEMPRAVVPIGNRGTMHSPQHIMGKVNTGGPEAWPSDEVLYTWLGDEPAPLQGGAASAPAGGTSPAAANPPTPAPDSVPAPVATYSPATPPPSSASPQSSAAPAGIAPSAQPAAQGVSATVPSGQQQQPSSVVQPVRERALQAAPTATPAAQPALPSVAQTGTPAKSAGPASAASQPSPPAQAGRPAQAPPAAQASGTALRGNVPAPASANATAATSQRPVIYMDEAGNVVPKPADPEAMLKEAERLVESTQYAEAISVLEEIKTLPISPALREKVLYALSDAAEARYAGKPMEGFDPILSTTSEAMNANLRSSRVPDALFRLGMAHLRVGNINEAEGHFNALKRRYPADMNVPPAFTNLGLALLDKKRYAEAAESYRVVMQEYPEASVLRDASVGMVKALFGKGDLPQAAVIADFVDKRWPRYYLSDPGFLALLARLSLGQGKLEPALQQNWLYYNLDPDRKDNEQILATIGDIYFRTNRPKPALEIFSEIVKRYPDSLSAATALMRMAEKGIFESPVSTGEMERVFVDPGTPLPQVAYKEIMRRWPDSPLAQLAQLKEAMWLLWNKQYTEAMGAGAEFIDAHPEHPDVEQAREVIVRGFMADLQHSLSEENYGRILILWNGFPLVRERYGVMDPVLRNALARGYLERGDDAKAMELFSEFLKTPKHPLYGDPTFALYFNKYLQTGNWNALLDLGETVKNWNMEPQMRRQLDYALALSAENLGLAERALPLWKQLAADDAIPLYQKAYATYFLARDAEQRKDIKDAYAFNKATLELFTKLEQERSDKGDPERIRRAIASLMDITEVANRIPEALEWVDRYSAITPETSPEYPGLRFREARLYRKLGDTAKARALLESIVQKSPDSPFAKAAESELRTFTVSRDLQNYLPPPTQQ